ncbi:MAG TPA: hypothetical protein VGH65_04860 [Verrucomicrobiaceae bacterium]
MKAITLLALPFCAAVLAACGSSENTAALVPASHGEFDQATGSWKPLTKVVAAPPHQEGAVIVDQKGPGMMDKVGKTLKKPLEWVGLAKDDTPPENTTSTAPKRSAAQQ